MARTFFDRWFVAINANEINLPRIHDKKLTIIALCALMEMASEAIPEGLRDGWPGIVGGALKVFKTLPKAVEGNYLNLICFLAFIDCSIQIEKSLSRSFRRKSPVTTRVMG